MSIRNVLLLWATVVFCTLIAKIAMLSAGPAIAVLLVLLLLMIVLLGFL